LIRGRPASLDIGIDVRRAAGIQGIDKTAQQLKIDGAENVQSDVAVSGNPAKPVILKI